MPKRTPPTIGRPQAGRPNAPAMAATQADGPRSLVGALTVPIEQITADPNQPRRAMDEEGLRDLAASLKEYGVLQPLLMREDGYLDDGRARYRIVAGGRRYAAALLAGLTRLPVIVRDTEGATLRLTQLVENVQRQDLAPLEEARAFKELMDAEGVSAEAVGARLHVSGQRVRERLNVLNDQVIADGVESGKLTPTEARDALRLPDEGLAVVRERLQEGAAVTRDDIKAIRVQVEAAGARNPRAKGGGRGARQEVAVAPTAPPSEPTDQARLDNRPPVTGPMAPLEGLSAAVGALDRGAVLTLLRYGIERQWTCRQLLDALNDQRPKAAP